MSQSTPDRNSRPDVPGFAQACLDEKAARAAIAESMGGIVRELSNIQKAIGTAPDPTAPEDERDGSGLRGISVRTFNALEELTAKVDKLSGTGNSQPPTAQSSAVKKVAYGLVIAFLAVQQAWTLYRSMTPQAPLPTAAQSAPH